MISAILLFVFGALYAYKEQRKFYSFRIEDRYRFFGVDSWVRKYSWSILAKTLFIETSPNNWYYRIFNIKYKEAFPLSATALVWLTDWYHAVQFLMIKALVLAVFFREGWEYWPLELGSYLGAYYLGFNLSFKFSRK